MCLSTVSLNELLIEPQVRPWFLVARGQTLTDSDSDNSEASLVSVTHLFEFKSSFNSETEAKGSLSKYLACSTYIA